MSKINIENLNSKQVDEIISLVNKKGGSIYATQEEKVLRVDLTKIKLGQRLELRKTIKQIVGKKVPHK